MKRYNIAAAEKMSLYPGTIFSPLIEITEADNGEWVRYEDERYRVTTDDWEREEFSREEEEFESKFYNSDHDGHDSDEKGL